MTSHAHGVYEDPSRMEGFDKPSAAPVIETEGSGWAAPEIKFEILAKLIGLNGERAALVNSFLEQVVETHDPDAVATFLAWKDHPVLDTILLLAAKLSQDEQDELLDHAEELAGRAGAFGSATASPGRTEMPFQPRPRQHS